MFRVVDYFSAGLIFGLCASGTVSQAETVDQAPAPASIRLFVDMRMAKPLSRSEELALKPQDMFKECEVCPEMILVPVGRFTMGSANYDGMFPYPTATGQVGEFRGKTLPVDSFTPNPWGLYQVHGNIFEWVEDCWHRTYHGAPTDGSAWTEEDCERRVLRGGAYNFAPWHLRSASRGEVAAAKDVYAATGMRVARSVRSNR